MIDSSNIRMAKERISNIIPRLIVKQGRNISVFVQKIKAKAPC